MVFFILPALGLRNPLAVHGAYPSGAFGLPPPGVNGEMSAAAYGAGLHLVSPQLNGAAAAGYGRSPVVRDGGAASGEGGGGLPG